MFHFDPNGYLVPDDVITTDIEAFQFTFVDSIPDKTRLEIFNNFMQFCQMFLEDLNLQEVSILINGSFTTRKQNPNDLDLVIFLDLERQQTYEQLLREKYNHEKLLNNLRLDVYFPIIYPKNHPNHAFTESDRAYWIDQFTRTRPNRRGVVYKKGLLQLTFTAHEIV